MAAPSSLLRVPVDMPDRSGHNMPFSNTFTGKTGTLIPVLCKELLPNDKVSLGCVEQVQFPAMVTDFYGEVDFVLEAFFVPNRLIWGGWQDFITHPTANPQYPEGTPVQAKPTELPYFYVNSPFSIPVDSCLHYLDYGKSLNPSSNPDHRVNVFAAIAYHRIWDDWYRDSRVQSPLFYRSYDNSLHGLPYLSTTSSGDTYRIGLSDAFSDNVQVFQLRQRNWVKDYFTTMSPLPQAGGGSEVKFDVVPDANTGAISIASLRAGNALQRWMERNNLAGYRYSDQIYAQFGIYPADAIMDRCLYLGRHIESVYNKSVYNTTPAGDFSNDPLGTKGANSQVLGEGSLVDSFTASEHGFLMVLASLVPKPTYGSGAERMNYRMKVGDFAFPLLSGMGDQAVLIRELVGESAATGVAGYTDLYAEYKTSLDRVHGLMRDGQSLDKFALQRFFEGGDSVEISSAFLQIPTNYLDQVQAIETSTSGYSYWAQVYFPFKKISTIPAYSQPTLADLKHAHTEYISRGGKRL